MRVLLASAAALLLLSVGPGATASTSTPPRNGPIAVTGPQGLYIVDPGTGTRSLVPKSAELNEPAWSPDGAWLAVSSLAGETPSVYTLKPDGTERTLVLENAYSPSWSPDGKQLVVVREDGESDGNALAVVDANGGHARTLEVTAAKGSVWVSGAEWSPDGKLIAFVTVHDDRVTIGFVSPDGKAASMPEVDADSPETGLSWSSDSTSIAFDRFVATKDGGGHYAVVVLDFSTGHESVYAGEQHGAQSPTWSPAGDQLAYLSVTVPPTSATTATTTHSCGGDFSVTHLWAMAPNGTKAHKLVEGEYYGTPSWARAPEADPALSDAG